jgi:hypothetical protein
MILHAALRGRADLQPYPKNMKNDLNELLSLIRKWIKSIRI